MTASHAERSAARLAALQALYQLEIAEGAPDDVIREFIEHRFGREAEAGLMGEQDEVFFTDVVNGVLKNQVEIDQMLARSLAKGWTLARIDAILRALLRGAGYELLKRRDVPARVIIDEYVELARDFFEGDEPKFVNGILDHMAKGNRGEEFGDKGGA